MGDIFLYDSAAETMPREMLSALQLERLQKMLAQTYDRVPYQRARLAAAGFAPGGLSSLAEVAQLPFTEKADLRDNYPFGLFAVPQSEILRLHASSGTTGRPTVVGYTHGDIARWADLMARSLACAGARPGDVVHNAYGYGLFTGGLGAHYGAERLGCTVVPMSGGNTERQIALIEDFAAAVLCCTPSYALNIAEVAERRGIDLARGGLRLGVFGAEPWSQAMRETLEARLGLAALDIYGLSEILGPGVAMECGIAQDGLHGWEDHFLFETIDPETGASLPEGTTGELVITTLTKEALPLIRYRTRDVTRIEARPCACGRTHRRIMRITGRSDDMLIIRGVNLYPSQIEAALLGFPGIAPHYQLVVERSGVLDSLTVEVELGQEVASEEARHEIAMALGHHLKAMIGLTCAIAIKRQGEVPRSQGKAVRVRDLRHGSG
jgi:phenylacetate-CoA ligase